ncbi:BadF/BadG/BcrA/BcrD ATPase family protein [Streptomyces sp. NPDC004539]|uniref:BadF/BadG/BcrA/BcrD ATPase family protein n=1 Tax=Streptomyces sp. NPDC004539 TaxID=3154280 RepID=UPI0033BBF985
MASAGPAYVLGVDAGGTRTRAVLADARDGRVLGEGVSGPGNALTVPVERVTEHLIEAIGAAVRGVAPGRLVAVAGGFAGAASVQAGEEGAGYGTPDAPETGPAPTPGPASAPAPTQGPTRASAPAPRPGQAPAPTPASAPVPASASAPVPPADEEPGRRHARTALVAALTHLGIPVPPISIHSDIEAAFAGAPGHPADGLALIAGTGSVAARVRGRVLVATSGGDGWLLGDDGSGFWIGRRAVRAALRAADGRDGPTTLVTLIGRALGVPEGVLPPAGWENTQDAPSPVAPTGRGADTGRDTPAPAEPRGDDAYDADDHPTPSPPPTEAPRPTPPSAEQHPPHRDDHGHSPAANPPRWSLAQRAAYRAHLLPAVMERRPTDLAAHAPLVTRAADEGDEVARQILQEAAAALVETVTALAPAPGEPLVVTGGLLAPDGPLLPPLTALLTPLGLTIAPVTDGSLGAVALARIAAGH